MTTKYGMIRCDKIERGVHHPVIPGYTKINASSMGPRDWKGLSPMLIGPFQVIEPRTFPKYFPDTGNGPGIHPGFRPNGDDPTTQITTIQKFENYWQGSKLYQLDIIVGPDGSSTLSKDFFTRRAQMFSLEKGKRRALPKAKAGLPVAGYYQGQIMAYVESRKKIYCPYYEELVTRTPEYAALVKKVKSGENLLIVGPDGRDIPITEESLREAVNDPAHIFGHELVICCLLIGIKPWID